MSIQFFYTHFFLKILLLNSIAFLYNVPQFAIDVFKKMRLPQIRDPNATPLDKLPDSYKAKIALIGCGPASISCASFLGRLGYQNVTIFEKENFPGGLSSLEIPQSRLPFDAISFEVQLMKDLGVKIEYGRELGKNLSIEQLKHEGYEALFMGIGQPDPRRNQVFEGLNEEQGFYTSKSFLPAVMKAAKPGMCGSGGCGSQAPQLPRLYGKVIVLGAGDTAMDCATSALRCGAAHVNIVFRRGFSEMRAVEEEFSIAQHERCDVLQNFLPKKVITRDGKIVALEMYKTEKNENGKLIVDEDEFIRLKCDFIISAFGSTVDPQSPIIEASKPLQFNDWGLIDVDDHMKTKVDWIFAGGDVVGNGLTVEAANDGKTASWHLHKYIQEKYGFQVPEEPQLPGFFTPVDKVDIGVEMCGIKFENPFGLASAPPATTAAMIKRAFEAGWSFAVTKTFGMDHDIVTNVSPRIVHIGETSGFRPGPNQPGYLNIELISEKSAAYWCEAIKQLKQEFPNKVVIASIMASYNKEDWQYLTRRSCEAGADAIELNTSCMSCLNSI